MVWAIKLRKLSELTSRYYFYVLPVLLLSVSDHRTVLIISVFQKKVLNSCEVDFSSFTRTSARFLSHFISIYEFFIPVNIKCLLL